MALGKTRDPSERRRRVMTVSMLYLVVLGGGALVMLWAPRDHWRPVDLVRIGGILSLALVLGLRATTNFRFTPRNPALDDELTRANRASAAGWGYWALMLALPALFVANFYWPMTLAETLPLLIVLGGVAAGLRFVLLERRGA